jgi:mRNA interferase RelE/StbE
MLKYILTKDALDFLRDIPQKHAKQIMEKIIKLAEDPNAVQTERLQGFKNLERGKSGEYRFIFRIHNDVLELLVLKIGKRNGGEVYKNLDHLDDN